MVSLIIEISQAWVPSRSSTIHDLILNILGGLAGIIVFRWFISRSVETSWWLTPGQDTIYPIVSIQKWLLFPISEWRLACLHSEMGNNSNFFWDRFDILSLYSPCLNYATFSNNKSLMDLHRPPTVNTMIKRIIFWLCINTWNGWVSRLECKAEAKLNLIWIIGILGLIACSQCRHGNPGGSQCE